MDNEPSVVYLKNVVDDPEIEVGEHTYYHDPFHDPRGFVKNNVLYHLPGHGEHISPVSFFVDVTC